jgi:hypothetical protein
MYRRSFGIVIVSVLALGALAGAACGGDDRVVTTASPAPVHATQTGSSEPISAGAIVPNTFLTYEGKQYRLSDILQANLIDSSEFAQVGQASHADVASDLTVFSRAGDATSVYTFWQGSGSGESAIPDSWYRWNPES